MKRDASASLDERGPRVPLLNIMVSDRNCLAWQAASLAQIWHLSHRRRGQHHAYPVLLLFKSVGLNYRSTRDENAFSESFPDKPTKSDGTP